LRVTVRVTAEFALIATGFDGEIAHDAPKMALELQLAVMVPL